MKRSALLLVALLWSSVARGQAQGWSADQDGSGFQLYGASAVTVGDETPFNGTTNVLCTNTSSGTLASCFLVAQAASSNTYPTAPLTQVGTYAMSYATTGAEPYFIAGSGALAYKGIGAAQFVFDIADTSWNWFWTARAAGVQVEEMSLTAANGLRVDPLAGSGTVCLQVDATGVFSRASGACGTGSGTTTNTTGTPPIFITGTSTVTPNVTIQGSIVSGSTSTSAQNIGALTTGLLKGTVSAGVSTISAAVSGTDYQPVTSHVCGGSQFVNEIDSTGTVVCATPTDTGITQLTHDVLAGPGSGSQSASVVGIEDDAICRGDLLFANESAPTTPGAGDTRVYIDSSTKNICALNDAGVVNHGIRDKTCSASTWISAVAGNGISTCSQPAFSDLTGSATCAQLPALTGDTHTSAGSCATVTDHITESGGPTSLAIGALIDTYYLVRSGSTVAGDTPTISSWPFFESFSVGIGAVTEWLEPSGITTAQAEYPVALGIGGSLTHTNHGYLLEANVLTDTITGGTAPSWTLIVTLNGVEQGVGLTFTTTGTVGQFHELEACPGSVTCAVAGDNMGVKLKFGGTIGTIGVVAMVTLRVF